MTVREALQGAGGELKTAGCPAPHVDAELLLAHALGVSRTALFADPDRGLSADEEERFRSFLSRRARREPAAYILGEWGFRRLTLAVDSRVLVPRPETEIVVERCLEHLAEIASPLVLDVGTGSGAIALSIADEHPGARIVATDISTDALALAAENRRSTGFEDRVELVLGISSPACEARSISSSPTRRTSFPRSSTRSIRRSGSSSPTRQSSAQGRRAPWPAAVARSSAPGRWFVLESGENKAEDVAAELVLSATRTSHGRRI